MIKYHMNSILFNPVIAIDDIRQQYSLLILVELNDFPYTIVLIIVAIFIPSGGNNLLANLVHGISNN